MAGNGVAARIADALLTYLGEATIGAPALPVSMPGAKFTTGLPFTPPADGKYLRTRFLPNEPGPALIGFHEPDEHRGLLQVSVIWPAGEGEIPALDYAGAVVALFRRGTVIPGDDLKVRIYRTPWVSPSLQEANLVQIPVTVPWTCWAATPV